MTGAGLTTGLHDVEALGRAVEAEMAGGPPALLAYEANRLEPARALALSSMRWSKAYVEGRWWTDRAGAEPTRPVR